jgi:hypothetical protein
LYRIVIEVVKVLKIDEALKTAGVHEAAKDAGVSFDAGKLLATLIMWFVALVFLVASLEVLGLSTVTIFLERVVLLYLPQVIIASLILILGAIVADAARRIVSGSAKAAGAHAANLAGTVAKWAIHPPMVRYPIMYSSGATRRQIAESDRWSRNAFMSFSRLASASLTL